MKDIKQSLVEIEADLKGRISDVNGRDVKTSSDNLHTGLGIGSTEGLSPEQVD